MSEIKVNVTNRVWLDWSKETHIHWYWEGRGDIFQLRVTYLNKHFRILDVGAWHLICSKYWMENQPQSVAGEQCDKSGICLSFEFDKFELYASLAWGWACAGLATQFQNIWKENFGSDSSCYGYAVSCNMPPHMLLLSYEYHNLWRIISFQIIHVGFTQSTRTYWAPIFMHTTCLGRGWILCECKTHKFRLLSQFCKLGLLNK